jgi:hypothetical protein
MPRNSEVVRSRFGLLAAVLAVATFAGAAIAQEPTGQNVDRARLLRDQTRMQGDPYSEENGVDDGRAVESPNDPDLGEQEILKRVDRYEPFTVSLSAPFYYTSNVALVRNGEESDVIFAPGAGITYAPRFTRTLYGSFTLQQSFFYYDRFSELDFGSSDFRAGLTYLLPKLHNLLLRAEYDYNRLTFSNSFDEFFSNHSLFFNAEIPFRFGRAQQLSLGADTNVSLHAEPEGPRRNDFDLYAGYSARLTRAFTVDAVARVFVRDYHENDRVDVSEILALSANYRITKCLSASAASTFAWSQSNQSVFDYNVVNIGGAFTLSFRF